MLVQRGLVVDAGFDLLRVVDRSFVNFDPLLDVDVLAPGHGVGDPHFSELPTFLRDVVEEIVRVVAINTQLAVRVWQLIHY